jgi:hypothetical protein
MGLTDRLGISLKPFSHVKFTNPRHPRHGQTGTVIRLDEFRRRVWVAMPEGQVVPARHRSVEVVVPRPQR